MAGLIQRRLAASTIIESIVALVIITISFGIGMTVFPGIAYPALGSKKEKAGLLLQAKINEVSNDPETGIYTSQTDDINIEVSVTGDSTGLQLLTINGIAKAGDNILAIKKILVVKYSKQIN